MGSARTLVVPVSNLLIYALGPIALMQPPWVAVGVTVAAVLVIGTRERMHGFGGALAGFRAGRDAQLQRRLPPCVYDERPRLPVGLAVGAADQAPRACDSAHGLTGKERAIKGSSNAR